MLLEEPRRLDQFALQPRPVVLLVQEDRHALLFAGLVEALVERVHVGVHGKHREREQCRPTLRVLPATVDAGDAEGEMLLRANYLCLQLERLMLGERVADAQSGDP